LGRLLTLLEKQMIRFVSVGKDIYCNNEPEIFAFSWFDTTVDRYIEICDSVIWSSWEEFEKDCRLEPKRKIDIGRFYQLFQEPGKMAKLEMEETPLTPAKYAEQLRRIMKCENLTVEQLAEKIEKTPQQLYEILENYPGGTNENLRDERDREPSRSDTGDSV